MSKPDKPIFNQQGGRGKLYGPTHGATYMGAYQMPDGKMDRRMFNCATNKDGLDAFNESHVIPTLENERTVFLQTKAALLSLEEEARKGNVMVNLEMNEDMEEEDSE